LISQGIQTVDKAALGHTPQSHFSFKYPTTSKIEIFN
jgi:hypothetical protein